jgi:hypothetical protein
MGGELSEEVVGQKKQRTRRVRVASGRIDAAARERWDARVPAQDP